MTGITVNEFHDRLKAQVFMFEEEPIDIVLLSDLEQVVFMGLNFSGGKKSTTISVPRYYAIWLYINGKARFNQPDLYTQLLNAFKQQAPNFKIQELRENLLVEALSFLENYNLYDQYKEYVSEQERNRIQETFYNLSVERLKRTLRDVTLNDSKKVEKYLDDLEKPIIKEVFAILTTYFDSINMKDK